MCHVETGIRRRVHGAGPDLRPGVAPEPSVRPGTPHARPLSPRGRCGTGTRISHGHQVQAGPRLARPVSNVSGTHDLYLRFAGGSGNLFNVDWWQFNVRGTPTPPPSPPPTTTPSPTTPSPTASATTPPTGAACTVAYRTTNSWTGGFQGEVTLTAGSAPIDGWTVRWTLGAGQSVGQVWNGTASTSGSTVTVRNTSYNGALVVGGSTTFGFIAGGAPSTPSFTCTSP
ncbi:cellulose binding domain-containing protein [Micromonosporaceae bacterium B7E4]